jgi:hypothetical protein
MIFYSTEVFNTKPYAELQSTYFDYRSKKYTEFWIRVTNYSVMLIPAGYRDTRYDLLTGEVS